MARETTPSESDKPASFQESMVLNLKRNKMVLQHKLQILDQAIQMAESNEDAVKFAQLMGELQAPQQ